LLFTNIPRSAFRIPHFPPSFRFGDRFQIPQSAFPAFIPGDSRLRVMRADGDCGLWSLGNKQPRESFAADSKSRVQWDSRR